MNDNSHCPCCGRHCDLQHPHCERGKEFLHTGSAPEQSNPPSLSKKEIRETRYRAMDLDNRLIMNLRDLGHTLRFLFEGKGSQKRILIILLENKTITQRELTARIGIQPGSASEVIGKLEDAGLIRRTPSQTDRRTADIQLTAAGREQAEKAAAQRRNRHQEMFSCLSAQEKDTLLALLEKLYADWESRYSVSEKDQGPHGRHERDCHSHRRNSEHGLGHHR